MWKEFKEFAVKGNAIDLAVGVIIGAAFGSIVTSLVKDIIMPPVSLLTGGLSAEWRGVFHAGRRGPARRGHVELRKFPHPRGQFSHRRLLHFFTR